MCMILYMNYCHYLLFLQKYFSDISWTTAVIQNHVIQKKSCKVRVDMTWILNLWTSLTCNCDLIVVHAVTNLNFEYMHNFYSFKIDLIMSLKKEITEMRKISCSKRLFIYLPSVLSMCSFISKLCFSLRHF